MQFSRDCCCLFAFSDREKHFFVSYIISEVLIYLMAISEMKTLLWPHNYLSFIESQFKNKRISYEKEARWVKLSAWIIQKCWNSIVMILTYEILFQFSKSPFIWTIKLKLNNFLNKSGKYFRSCLRLPEKEGFVLSSQKPEPSCQITKAHWSQ